MPFLKYFNEKVTKFLNTVPESQIYSFKKSCNELMVIYYNYYKRQMEFDNDMLLVKIYHSYVKKITDISKRQEVLDYLMMSYYDAPGNFSNMIENIYNGKKEEIDKNFKQEQTDLSQEFKFPFSVSISFNVIMELHDVVKNCHDDSVDEIITFIDNIKDDIVRDWILNLKLDNTNMTISKALEEKNIPCINLIMFETFLSELMCSYSDSKIEMSFNAYLESIEFEDDPTFDEFMRLMEEDSEIQKMFKKLETLPEDKIQEFFESLKKNNI